MGVIKIRSEETNNLKTQLQNERVSQRLLADNTLQETKQLHTKLREMEQRHLQQTELLKSKMAILHQNDITSLVHTYESKIECITRELATAHQAASQLRNTFHQ